MIRSSRLRKYKKRRKSQPKKLPILLQVAVINYSLLVTGAYLTSPTNASFNDIERINNSIHVAWEWEDDDGEWDKSSLKAIGQGINEEGEIYAIIINKAENDMKGPVVYELYWTEKGNPKPEHGGFMLTQGEIPALVSNGEYTIYFSPTVSGNYMFKIYQRTGHPGIGHLWSEAITVNQENIQQTMLPSQIPQLTEEDQLALKDGRITEADLERYLSGEITREELEELKSTEPKLTLPELTEEDKKAFEEGKITSEDLEKYLKGEITREDLENLKNVEPDEQGKAPGGGGGGGAATPPNEEEEVIPQEPIRNEEEEMEETSPTEDAKQETPESDSEEEDSKEESTIETPEEEEEPIEATPGLEEEGQDEEEAPPVAEEQGEEADEQEDHFDADNDEEDTSSEVISEETEESDTETDSDDTEESESSIDSDDTDTESSGETAMIQTLVRALT